jgi:hypothetical protein
MGLNEVVEILCEVVFLVIESCAEYSTGIEIKDNAINIAKFIFLQNR